MVGDAGVRNTGPRVTPRPPTTDGRDGRPRGNPPYGSKLFSGKRGGIRQACPYLRGTLPDRHLFRGNFLILLPTLAWHRPRAD